MIRSRISAGALIPFAAFTSAAQSAGSGASAPSEPSKPSAQSQSPAPSANAAAPKDQSSDKDQAKKKPKKVWTNEEMSAVHGNISVVGDPAQAGSSSDSQPPNTDSDSGNSGNSERARAIANYREQLRQLHQQQNDINKKIADFRNFKADNASPSGGINVRNRYSMTPTEDQIRQLEDKKKQIQVKIDA